MLQILKLETQVDLTADLIIQTSLGKTITFTDSPTVNADCENQIDEDLDDKVTVIDVNYKDNVYYGAKQRVLQNIAATHLETIIDTCLTILKELKESEGVITPLSRFGSINEIMTKIDTMQENADMLSKMKEDPTCNY